MTLLISLVVGYFGLLLLLSLLVRGRRAELATLANDLLQGPISEHDEIMIYMNLKHAYSLWVAPAHLLFLLAALITPMSVLERKALEFCDENTIAVHDPRYRRFFVNFNLSVAAANPLFGIPALLVREILFFKIRAYLARHPENAGALKAYRKCAT